ncbi:MAG: hypothetical protein ACRD63_04025 [Pyrinomonadaceae bacterium]
MSTLVLVRPSTLKVASAISDRPPPLKSTLISREGVTVYEIRLWFEISVKERTALTRSDGTLSEAATSTLSIDDSPEMICGGLKVARPPRDTVPSHTYCTAETLCTNIVMVKRKATAINRKLRERM